MPSTHPHIPRLSFIFDFDLTLASDSAQALCEELGFTAAEWHERFRAPLGDGWGSAVKKAQALLDAAEAVGRPLTREVFAATAERIEVYPGVLDMPGRIEAEVERVLAGVECEFVILSAGFDELIVPTRVADAFGLRYAGAFHFVDGRAVSVKRTISHAEKALYLRAHAEGLPVDDANAPGTSTAIVDEHERHVPFDQIVYAGDGASDLQAFGFLGSKGGLTIGIENHGSFDAAAEQTTSQRVDKLAAADYRDGSVLMEALLHAARAGASRIALRASAERP